MCRNIDREAGRERQEYLPGGARHQGPAAGSILTDTGLFYVPTNHVCMDYEPFRVSYTAGQPYVGATLSMYPPQGETNMGNFIAWDARTGKIVWSVKEQFSVWSVPWPRPAAWCSTARSKAI